MQGKAVEVESVEGRPPKTIDVPDEKGGQSGQSLMSARVRMQSYR
jgi:hypothetical protein